MFWQSLDAFLTRIRPRREALSLALDGLMIFLAWQATYLFRLGFERWISARPSYDGWVIAGLVALYLLSLWLFKVPKGMWRFSGFGEVQRVTLACAAAGILGAVVILMAQLQAVPRAVLALHPVFSIIGLAMMRLAYRMLYEHLRARINGRATETHRALILGAGQAGRLLVAGIQHQGWTVVGWLDDDQAKQDSRVAGIPVLGPLSEVDRFAELHGITHIIVAMPSADVSKRRQVLDLAGKTGLPVLTVPSSAELMAGSKVDQLRDIQPEDLLGREPVQLDEAGISECLNDKVVLITGAGGSIGSELCRQVARYGPSKIVLYEMSEFALYTIEQELSEKFPRIPLVRLVGDVKDLEHLRYTFGKYKPQIVFHAAAYKHVPLMEVDNAWACLRNNVLGTYRTALAATESSAERFVLISTDKAVNPTNVMGASKRAAEMVLSSLSSRSGRTRLTAVRFGNVLGSSGSVIPKFKEQLVKGGPLTVTHPEVTRYFMTIPEAAGLVLQAATLAKSGEVYVLDMGESVRIVDLARNMLRLSGHPDTCITFTGLRPGEKLYEELLADADVTLPSPHPRLRIARLSERGSEAWLAEILVWLGQGNEADELSGLRPQLQRFVAEYRPS